MKKEETGFNKVFLSTLIEESIFVLLENMPEGTNYDLLENVSYLVYALSRLSEGGEYKDLDPAGIRERVEAMTNQIWELGGTFHNSYGEYVRKDLQKEGAK